MGHPVASHAFDDASAVRDRRLTSDPGDGRSRRRFGRLLLGTIAGVAFRDGPRAQASAEPLAVLSDDGPAYAEVLEELRRQHPRLRKVGAEELGREGRRLVVAVGTRALESVLAAPGDFPVLATLTTRSGLDRVLGAWPTARVRVSAVVLDQPLPRSIELARLLVPEAHRFAVLLGTDSRAAWNALQAHRFEPLQWRTDSIQDESELHRRLVDLLPGADVFLALPDRVAFNPRTAQNVLLTTYRYRVPVIAFSPGYVQAGALAAVYSTPRQIGAQTAVLLDRLVRGASAGTIQTPGEFSVAINVQVARSLGLTPLPENEVHERLKAQEGSR